MSFPTVASMVRILGITEAQAKLARKVGKCGGRAQLDALLAENPALFPKSTAWVAQCYNPPYTSELRMSMLDDALDTHGVEALHKEGEDDPRKGPFATYCNTGDSYAATIIRFRSGTYALRCWADVVEANRL